MKTKGNYPVDYKNTIKKSNELSMAKLNQGLTLNQMQLFAYAIYSTQQNGKTDFRKYEFQNKFGLQRYNTESAYEDSGKISSLQFSVQDLENKKFKFTNVFSSIEYLEGLFLFKWNEDMLPHILELKEKYVMMDLTVTSNFKSGFSWVLYDYLKAHYGFWHKELSKDAFMKLFSVEDKKTYQKSTAQFKRGVLDVAISEVNKYTELNVWYIEKKVGNKITGFILHWTTEKREVAATDKQLYLLRQINTEVERRFEDYLSLKNENNRKIAKVNLKKIKSINRQVNDMLTVGTAKDLIGEAKTLYEELQLTLERDGKTRDTSFYYNWLEEQD